ncbi:hypothetical protein KKQ10_18745 [Pseudomonas sp. MG-9]|uniref:Uncharacterized protein n=1 Tax=Pseudomonas serboccidentalis TaxID=2964670 RepID=A0ABY7Z424_9PSED|nr:MULTISPECIES: hypothetical protein [Pseudomonas]MBT9266925.1 hypothetical protein [Pseudomonas sp. MG-9]WDR34026.1 hypothetical protein NN484_16040 [Pseudomonas serboccidentalis]
MTTSKNFAAVDWCTGPDRLYFFFREKNTYARFDIGDNKVLSGYPKSVDEHWEGFDKTAADLRFGFTTTSPSWDGGIDTLWLFYDDGDTPSVCEFNQRYDKAVSNTPVAQSKWAKLLPYYYKIVGAMCNENNSKGYTYWILLNDGNYLTYEIYSTNLQVLPLKNSPWDELTQYQGRMMTAALNDYPTFDTYFYIFLNDNQYLRYEQGAKKLFGPYTISESTWPGLLTD